MIVVQKKKSKVSDQIFFDKWMYSHRVCFHRKLMSRRRNVTRPFFEPCKDEEDATGCLVLNLYNHNATNVPNANSADRRIWSCTNPSIRGLPAPSILAKALDETRTTLLMRQAGHPLF